MRRGILTLGLAAMLALAVAVPGSALAHGNPNNGHWGCTTTDVDKKTGATYVSTYVAHQNLSDGPWENKRWTSTTTCELLPD